MEVSAEDQFKRLRAQIIDTQELMYLYWAHLAGNSGDLLTLGMYQQAITIHAGLRAEVDLLYPPNGK